MVWTPLSPFGNPNGLRRRGLLLAAPGGIALLAGCATPPTFEPPPARVDVAVPQPGQSWRYRVINRYNGAVTGTAVYRVAAAGPRIDVSLPSSNIAPPADGQPDVPRVGATVFTDPHHVSEELFFDVPCRFETPDRLLPDQLSLGPAPVVETACRRPDASGVLRWRSQVHGDGWERIEVPAGRFLALRVSRQIAFTHPDIARVRSTRRDTLWFAPALGHWVAREWSGQYIIPGPRRGEVMQDDWVRFELI